jgi:hypothetical protein
MMSSGQRLPLARLALALILTAWAGAACSFAAPPRIGDREFWRMVVEFSEPGGEFRASGAVRSDNLISNETGFEPALALLRQINRPGAYIGVGPDQNFTYITTLQPTIAFIVDIRRDNLRLHLLFKALVEMSDDRADFLSRLFARPRPPQARRRAAPAELLAALRTVPHSAQLAAETREAVLARLQQAHGFALTAEDAERLASAYDAFGAAGPDIRWDSSGERWIPSYADLMGEKDQSGRSHSYLASETSFAILKAYEEHNRIVPLVGDFGGDKAIRAIAAYLREHRDVVAAFYTSNVESYLRGEAARKFAANVAALPFNQRSALVRAVFRMVSIVEDRPQYRNSVVLLSMADFVRSSAERERLPPSQRVY